MKLSFPPNHSEQKALLLQLCDTSEVKKKQPVPFEPWLHIQKGRATESEQAWVIVIYARGKESREKVKMALQA